MKNTLLILLCAAVLAFSNCSKDSTPANNNNALADTALELQVMKNFANVLVNPNYLDIQTRAGKLKAAVDLFVATPTDANLAATRQAWKDTRAAWESCEGFLFGPVEDNNYDPTMDSWPVNKTDLDALLASSNPLTVADIDALPSDNLRGFHAIEYVIFGVGSTRTAAQLNARDMVYLSSLTTSLYNTTTALQASWDPSKGNFTAQVLTAGHGSTYFSSRNKFFTTLVGTMSGICDEVGTGKMNDGYVAKDSTLDESSFSHNSTADFTNNITGVRNAYLCQYGGTSGTYSLSSMVAAKNSALDIKIKTEINAAIASFGTITVSYEKAIYTQRAQIVATQAAIATLKATLDGDLQTFIKTYVKD